MKMKLKPLSSEGFVTLKDYTIYLKFNMLKGKYYRLKVFLIRLLLAVATLTLLLLGYVKHEKSLWIAAGAIILCFLMFSYTVNTNVKRVCNKSAKVVRAKQRVQFGKNGFVFELLFQNEEENEYNEIFYDELEALYLAPHAMYLYIEKRSVIVVPKRNINITPAEALAFLQEFVPAEKLVVCI